MLHAACCMLHVHWDTGSIGYRVQRKRKKRQKEKQGEGRGRGRQRHKKRDAKKQEQRRLQLACRKQHTKDEPHAPTQRRPTSMNTAEWSAKLREKARKKRGRVDSKAVFDNNFETRKSQEP